MLNIIRDYINPKMEERKGEERVDTALKETDMGKISEEHREYIFSDEEKQEAIGRMCINSSSGPDGFPEFYEWFGHLFAGHLCELFSQCLFLHRGDWPKLLYFQSRIKICNIQKLIGQFLC